MPLNVNQKSAAVEVMAADWPMLDALMGGTRAMRAAGTALLPKWPAEEQDAYDCRLKVATLYPAYQRTVAVMAGKPFSKPLTLEATDQIVELCQDIDRQGCSLHVFAAEMFEEIMGFGLGGILVDYPKATLEKNTLAEVQKAGLRPYWVRYKHDQILGWQTETVNGSVRLSQLRLLESYEEPDGPYGTATKKQVRVLIPGSYTIWRESGNRDTWEIVEEGTTTLGYIPFVPLYGKRLAYMVGRAPLLNLAYLNVKHWQSQSDQDTIEHVARVPILTVRATGSTSDKPFELKVGASAAVDLGDNQYAEMKYVEHTGAAIKAGAESLMRLADQMVETGAELLVKRTVGNVSATGESKDAEANKSDLQRIAEVFTDSLNQALQMTADWIKQPEGGTVKLFSDYGAASLSDASAQLVKDLQAGGQISHETLIAEMKRRGILDEAVDAATELERIGTEGPSLGTLTDSTGLGSATA